MPNRDNEQSPESKLALISCQFSTYNVFYRSFTEFKELASGYVNAHGHEKHQIAEVARMLYMQMDGIRLASSSTCTLIGDALSALHDVYPGLFQEIERERGK